MPTSASLDNDTVIMTACDQRFFPLVRDLIDSLKNACGTLPRLRVLDLGMSPAQLGGLAGQVEKVIVPDWDVGADMNLPPWYRAMTARPFLPKYAGDAALITWIDADAWVQRFGPLGTMMDAARDGALAIVEERFGKGFSAQMRGPDGVMRTMTCSQESVKANVRSCYEVCFGPDIATAFGDLPCFNNGVFALRADSPSWKVWQDIYGPALARHFHFMSEQQALNVGIRQGRIPIAQQPQEANFTCHLELPWYAPEKGAFTFPGDAERVLGVVHLCDTKKFELLPIPQFPQGQPRAMPLIYRSVQQFTAQAPHTLAQADDLARNAPCPCGSGKKFKHCHGQLA
jgi:SEC-C motif